MRTINRSRQFKKDYKRERSGRHGHEIDSLLMSSLNLLLQDVSLPPRMHDHALTGEWHDHRDCHLKPDLVLIYRKPDPDTFDLVRLGSHSELGI